MRKFYPMSYDHHQGLSSTHLLYSSTRSAIFSSPELGHNLLGLHRESRMLCLERSQCMHSDRWEMIILIVALTTQKPFSCPLCILANERSERGLQIPPDSLVINRLYADLISIKLTQILSDRPRVLRNWTLTALSSQLNISLPLA